MNTADTTTNDTAREHLRATVREILDDHRDGTADTDTAERMIMDAAQAWTTGDDAPNARAARLCPGSNTSVNRWHAPNGWGPNGTDVDPTPDPGPYTEGEHATCPTCRADTPITRTLTNQRETGTQYVAWLAQH